MLFLAQALGGRIFRSKVVRLERGEFSTDQISK